MTDTAIINVPDQDFTYIHVPKLNAHPAFRLVNKATFEVYQSGLVGRQFDGFSYKAEAIVAKRDEEYHGFLAFEEVDWNKSIDILFAWVAPEHRGQGVHTRMFRTLVKHAREKGFIAINSSTHVDNVDAQRAFERQGRKPVSIRYEFQLEEW